MKKDVIFWLMTLFLIMSLNINASDSSPQRSAINLGIPVIEISNNQINNVQLRTTWPDADVIVELINSNATSPMIYVDDGNYSNFWVTSFKADESPDYFQNLLAATEYNHNRWIERGAPERELFSNIAMLTAGFEKLIYIDNGNGFNFLNNNSLENASLLSTAEHLNRWIKRVSKTEYLNSFDPINSVELLVSDEGHYMILKKPITSFVPAFSTGTCT